MTDLFTNSQTNENPFDPNKNYLEELVGDNKKFKSVEDLAKGKAEADSFIERLQREMEGLRGELKTRTNLEEVLDRLQNPPSQNANTQSSHNNQNGDNGDDSRTAIKPEDIEKLIDDRVSARERKRIEQDNVAFVSDELKKAFGDNYVNRLETEARNLGLTKEDVNRMAAQQPKVLLRILSAETKTDKGPDLFTPPRSQMNVQPGNVTGTTRNQAFYNAIKKSDPKKYWEPSTQNQMHKDAIQLGERFFT